MPIMKKTTVLQNQPKSAMAVNTNLISKTRRCVCSCFLLLVILIALSTVPVAVGEEVEEQEDAAVADNVELADGDTSDIPEDNDVLVLNNGNFDSAIKNNPAILVEFYAPWCGHCKALAPEYEKAAKKLRKLELNLALAKVDATVEAELGKKYGVSGYPTLKFFKNGEMSDYDGPREADGIVQWMRERGDPNWTPPPSDVVVLSDSNFTDIVGNADIILVEFYAPWCGHCKRLAPEYEQAATLLKSYPEPIILAKVDATVETTVAKQHEVSGYPALYIFRKGKRYEYKGPRTGKDMAYYMIQQSGLCSQQLNTTKDVKKNMHDKDVTIVAFFKSDKDPVYNAYMEAGNEIRDDFRFGHTFDEAARQHYGIKPGSIALFHPERFHSDIEKPFYEFNNPDATAEDIKEFYKIYEVPMVGHRNSETDQRRYSKRRPLVVVYYTVDFSFDYRDATQHWRQKILLVAKDFPEYTFAIANEDEYAQEFKDMGLDTTGEEVNVAIFGDKNQKFPMSPDDEFDSDTLREFVEKFKNGQLKPYLKSQPPPKKNDGLVKVVVGKTFDKLVNDPTKDVLIEFYAPWCGHCKQLVPIYKEFGKKHKNNKNLVVAKMDATANDVPLPYEVTGFPTIYFATANNKEEPVVMDSGDRTVAGLDKFVSEHQTVSKDSGKDEL